MDKKLSIIVPNYNNEKYLKRSLECLINQTYKNIEIIVVNDGSKGKSDEIVEKYQKQDKRKPPRLSLFPQGFKLHK